VAVEVKRAGVLAAVNSKALWYLSRGTGIVCLVLLTASVVLGILEVKRWSSPRWPRFVTAGLHKNISLLVVAFVTVHVVTVVVDGFAPIRWLDAIVPFASKYRPIWLGFGALAADLLIALIATSLIRPRIGSTAWRAVHWLTYLCWPVALVHGLGTGTDARHGWVLLLALACLAVVVGSVWWRLAAGAPQWTGARTAAAVLGAAAPLAILGWFAVGPMKTGWAARAGTPASLLGSQPAGATAATTAPTAPSAALPGNLQAPFSATLTGTIAETRADAQGNVIVTIAGSLSGGASGHLQIVLQGASDSQGGVQMSTSAVTLGPSAGTSEYQGQITRLGGTRVVAALTGDGGRTIQLTVSLQIDSTNTHVTGSVQATAG
jgi:sulfoxide reductase heme-binding subunit YedZ